ncbi:MAG: glycoside hydrolase family 5 protein [Solirubrobacteraceae bacterium]
MPAEIAGGPPRALALAGILLILVVTGAAPARAAPASGLRVVGNQLVFGPGAGTVLQPRGVDRSGLEYACIQGWGFFDSSHPQTIDTPAMIDAMLGWDIDIVRVPLNEDCWLGVNAPREYSGAPYRRIVRRYVHALNAAGLFVILDLHWAAPGRTPANRQLPMADADHAPAFWRSVARTFAHDDDLIFDLYNEPFGIGWSCWLHGCEIPASGSVPAYRAAGMQQLVDAVRSTGATQPLLLGGIQWALDMSGWLAHEPSDPLHQLIASDHNYGGLRPCDLVCEEAILATHRHVPVLFGELGETDCGSGYIEAMMGFADAHGIGYLAWAWDATSPGGWSCRSGPSLISSYDGAPTAYGAGFRAHLLALGVPVRLQRRSREPRARLVS